MSVAHPSGLLLTREVHDERDLSRAVFTDAVRRAGWPAVHALQWPPADDPSALVVEGDALLDIRDRFGRAWVTRTEEAIAHVWFSRGRAGPE